MALGSLTIGSNCPVCMPASTDQGSAADLGRQRAAAGAPEKFTPVGIAAEKGGGRVLEGSADSGPAAINEEELQHLLVTELLGHKGVEAQRLYGDEFQRARAAGMAVEDAVKAALRSIVQHGALSADEATVINGRSFRAAQLDANLDLLYDSRGSAEDPTIAVRDTASALASADRLLLKIAQGIVDAPPRSLSAPSNSIAVDSGGVSWATGAPFLWKPKSERDGNLVVLLPAALTGKVEGVSLYRALPLTEENRIEDGSFSGDRHNGGRAHFRFRSPGDRYPDGVIVAARLSNGDVETFTVQETSRRHSA